jgi:putative hydrolase of the HAD superfamily
MENDLLESIKPFLEESEVMQPLETGVEPVTGKFSPKAVIFDIYGTLLISASGDVEEASLITGNLQKALDKARIRVVTKDGLTREELLRMILDEFKACVNRQHEKHKAENGVAYPEVDILETWEVVVQYFLGKGFLEQGKYSNTKLLAYVFELLSNSIYPMPGMKKVIQEVHGMDIPLGIVSNAQAYTPFFLNYYLNGSFDENLEIEPFDPRLTIYSFRERRAKPDHQLFSLLGYSLRNNFNISPGEAVYVGNDMLNDIYAASQAGLKTVLFAGDQRSLRMRSDHPLVSGTKPDFIITELPQFLDIIS